MSLLDQETKKAFQENKEKRKELQERMQLIDFDDFYFSLINSLPFGILIHDSQHIVFLNKMASDILEGEPSDFIGDSLKSIFPESNRSDYITDYKNIVEGESTFVYQDVCFLKKDGGDIAIKTLGIPIKGKRGLIAQVVFLTENALEKLLSQIK